MRTAVLPTMIARAPEPAHDPLQHCDVPQEGTGERCEICACSPCQCDKYTGTAQYKVPLDVSMGPAGRSTAGRLPSVQHLVAC